MRDTEIVNARITGTEIGIHERGFFTWSMLCEWSGSGCSFGGYVLDAYEKKDEKLPVYMKGHKGHADGILVIRQILETCGVESWEDLKGTYVRVESEGLGGGIVAIGHIIENKWFNPVQFFNAAKEAENGTI